MTDPIKTALDALYSCTPGDYSTGHVIHPSFDEAAVDAAIAALEGLEKAEPFGTVTVVKREGCVDMHWFYPWPEPSYLDNAAEVHRVYTHPAPVQAEPSGWKLVPVEPTPEMIAAAGATPGMQAIDAASTLTQIRSGRPLSGKAFEDGSPLAQAYRAMLNAAPQPPADHFPDTKKMMAEPAAQVLPELASMVVNEAAWKFVEAMPHELPGPIWNDLKPAVYAALCYYHAKVLGQAAPQPAAQSNQLSGNSGGLNLMPAAQVVGLTLEQIDDISAAAYCAQDRDSNNREDDFKVLFARAAIAEFCRVNGIKPPEKGGA